MQTPINCPQCGTQYIADIYQIVDAQQTPSLKQMLIGGSLNVASCQNCGAATRIATPLLFHDAEHELLMIHIPMEMNMSMAEQNQLVGQMTKAITDRIPQEQFRGYLLQPPQQMLTMKSFMEKVYATEGITPEMIERQQNQMNLIQDLMEADKDRTISLIEENEELLDETFFAMFQSLVQSVMQSPNADDEMLKLGNLQARLYTMTETGRAMERRQLALRKFQQEAQEMGGLTHQVFLKYLLEHKDDEVVLDGIIRMGQQGITYELFGMLSAEIEKAELANQQAEVESLTGLRTKLLALYEAQQEATRQLLEEAKGTLDAILAAEDAATAVQQNLERIDEPFMLYLASRLEAAEQKKDTVEQLALKNIQNLIQTEAEKQMPPQLRLLNSLLSTDDPAAQKAIIDQLPAEERPQLLELLKAMEQQAAGRPDEEILKGQLQQLQGLVTLAA